MQIIWNLISLTFEIVVKLTKTI